MLRYHHRPCGEQLIAAADVGEADAGGVRVCAAAAGAQGIDDGQVFVGDGEDTTSGSCSDMRLCLTQFSISSCSVSGAMR
ncbi:MAG: hypothetical protein U0V64_14620 [Cyclobacteriaceae bacterium]